MTRLRVVTWNAEGMFTPPFAVPEGVTYLAMHTRRASVDDAVATIQMLDADIVVIPEFGSFGQLEDEARAALHALGYNLVEVPYEDRYQPQIMLCVLSRLTIVTVSRLRLGDLRNAAAVTVSFDDGRHLRLFGVHLDDDNEAFRMQQVPDLVQEIVSDHQTPTLVMGDFNAMDAHSFPARIARSVPVRWFAAMVPSAKLRHIVRRVVEMASGTTIRSVEHRTHLYDLDDKHRLTISAKQAGLEWVPAIRLAKIDWIFGTKHFRVERYSVYRDVGSDHRPVVADLVL